MVQLILFVIACYLLSQLGVICVSAKRFSYHSIDSYQALLILYSRRSKNSSEEYKVPIAQQRENEIIGSPIVILRNNSRLESTTNRSNSNSTILPNKNDTKNTTTRINVEAILNIKHSYQLKKGAKVIDSLPGIKNKFGDRVRGKRKYPIQVNHLKSSELRELVNSQQRMILLPNYKGLGNRLHLFSGLYFLSIRHRIPIIIPYSALWHKVWTIRQNYTRQIVYVPDEDIAYLLHYSYLLVVKPYGKYQKQDMQYISNTIKLGEVYRLFPTRITAVIGNVLILRNVIDCVGYYDILQYNGIESYQKNVSSDLRQYYCYGEFLRNVMQITELTKEVMKVRYPIVFEQPFDAIQLRMGGKLSDLPLKQKWLSLGSLAVAVRCIESHFKTKNVYVASDSMYAKNYLKKNLKNRNVSFVNEKVLFSDTQVMNLDGASIATYTAVADLYILGKSKSCIMTSGSTFAYAGCAISGNPPITLTMNGKKCYG